MVEGSGVPNKMNLEIEHFLGSKAGSKTTHVGGD